MTHNSWAELTGRETISVTFQGVKAGKICIIPSDEALIRGEGLIPKNPPFGGGTSGRYQGIKPESNTL
jgi:hypothetical protein